ncbi:MAG TPA: hypothetical protein VNI77_07705 [Nitrososphaera sp.]|nr:hypothetical protein [Nitrososphaera sp.]
MSGYSEDDIRRAADIREWLIKQISDKQEEVDRLRATLTIIDNLLKQGSFRAAASIGFATAGPAGTAQVQQTRQAGRLQGASPAPPSAESATTFRVSSPDRDSRPLKRVKDDFLLANAEVSPTSIIIVPAPGVNLNVNTPPFKSFFLNRILDGMKNKDANQGIKEPDALNYKVEDDNGTIKRIVINNYRDKDRLQEIFNTSTWVFTRMLEKSG